MQKAKVIIIGAGAAGIAAASRLAENGFKNFLILEAENRIGGRIYSTRFGGSIIDLGAQWCHGEKGNIVYQLVKDFNILEPSFNTYSNLTCSDSKGNFIDKQITDKLFDIFREITYDEDGLKKADGSYADYFIKR